MSTEPPEVHTIRPGNHRTDTATDQSSGRKTVRLVLSSVTYAQSGCRTLGTGGVLWQKRTSRFGHINMPLANFRDEHMSTATTIYWRIEQNQKLLIESTPMDAQA